jgi:hypothetical protein
MGHAPWRDHGWAPRSGAGQQGGRRMSRNVETELRSSKSWSDRPPAGTGVPVLRQVSSKPADDF